MLSKNACKSLQCDLAKIDISYNRETVVHDGKLYCGYFAPGCSKQFDRYHICCFYCNNEGGNACKPRKLSMCQDVKEYIKTAMLIKLSGQDDYIKNCL